MGKSQSKSSIGKIILKIALSLLLIVGGIWGIQKGGDAAVVYLRSINSIVAMVFAIIELVMGVLLFLELFIGDKFGAFDKILGWIIIIVFAVVIVLADILGSHGLVGAGFSLSWLYNTAIHLVFLGAMLCLND